MTDNGGRRREPLVPGAAPNGSFPKLGCCGGAGGVGSGDPGAKMRSRRSAPGFLVSGFFTSTCFTSGSTAEIGWLCRGRSTHKATEQAARGSQNTLGLATQQRSIAEKGHSPAGCYPSVHLCPDYGCSPPPSCRSCDEPGRHPLHGGRAPDCPSTLSAPARAWNRHACGPAGP